MKSIKSISKRQLKKTNTQIKNSKKKIILFKFKCFTFWKWTFYSLRFHSSSFFDSKNREIESAHKIRLKKLNLKSNKFRIWIDYINSCLIIALWRWHLFCIGFTCVRRQCFVQLQWRTRDNMKWVEDMNSNYVYSIHHLLIFFLESMFG